MKTQHQHAIACFNLLVVGTASCDAPPLAPEMPTPAFVPAAAEASSDQAIVGGETPHRFRFEIAFIDEGARELRTRILAQADRWARIVEGSDLEDIRWEPGTISCGDLQHDYPQDVVDDVFVMVSVRDYFTGPTAGAGVQICGYRESSKLPMIGAVFLDIEGLRQDHVDDLVLHQFAHMLGFGVSWEGLDLLRNSSWHNEGADTHFTGRKATAAFIAAGGASYHTGNRVPVENDGTHGSVDHHWRKTVFGNELMASSLDEGVANPLSAITIQSLADIGYTVDLEEAERFIIPARSNVPESAADGRHRIDLSGDVVAVPAVFYDRHGRVVRVVRD